MALSEQEYQRLKFLTQQRSGLGLDAAGPKLSVSQKFGRAGRGVIDSAQRGFGEDSSVMQLIRAEQERAGQAEDFGDILGVAGRTARGVVPRGIYGSIETLFGGAISAISPFIPEDQKRESLKKIEPVLTTPFGPADKSIIERAQNIDQNIVNNLDTLGIKLDLNDKLDAQFVEDIKTGALSALDLFTFRGVDRVMRATSKGVDAAKQGVVSTTRKGLGRISKPGEIPTPRFAKEMRARNFPKTQAELENAMVTSFRTSFVDSSTQMTKALKSEARRQSFGDIVETPDSLLLKVVREAALPDGSKDLADFTEPIERLTRIQTTVQKPLLEFLDTIPEQIPTQDFIRLIRQGVAQRPEILGQTRRMREIDRFIKDIDGLGKDYLSGRDIHQIRVDANGLSKAFKDEIFKSDVMFVIGDAARKMIDRLNPTKEVRRANKEYGRLQRIIDTVEIFDAKPIKVNKFLQEIGRLGGLTLLGGGLTAFGFGGGMLGASLIIAGIFARLGGDFITKFLKSNKFPVQAKEQLLNGIQRMGIADEIIAKTKNAKNQAFLRKALPAAGESGAPIQVGPKTVDQVGKLEPAARFNPPGRSPETGKFQRAFKSISEKAQKQFDEAKQGPGGTQGGHIKVPWAKPELSTVRGRNLKTEATDTLDRYLKSDVNLGPNGDLAVGILQDFQKTGGGGMTRTDVAGAVNFLRGQMSTNNVKKNLDNIVNQLGGDGTTFDLVRGEFPAGVRDAWAVGLYPERAFIKEIDKVTRKDVLEFLEQNKDLLLNKKGLGFGGWSSDGKLYLDVIGMVKKKADAVRLGKESDQIEIFGLKNFESANTGGTGQSKVGIGDLEGRYARLKNLLDLD